MKGFNMLSTHQLFLEGKMESALLQRIESNVDLSKSEVDNKKGAAIAIAKGRGFLEQDGKNLKMTEKGKKAAQKAVNTMEDQEKLYDPEKDKWIKSS